MIRRVKLRNYKSIAACDVRLGPLTILVGPNGSGKSNFVDALRFVKDALDNTMDWALRHQRGGVQKVRRISRGHPRDFGIDIEVAMPDGLLGTYSFDVGPKEPGGFVVKHERCLVVRDGALSGREDIASFRVEAGRVVDSSSPIRVALEPDRLALVSVSGMSEFRPIFDALCGMTFYDLNPRRMRDLQDPDPGLRLRSDGGNIASVIRELERAGNRGLLDRIHEHLRAVFPDLVGVHHEVVKSKEALQFKQRMQGGDDAWTFDALNMSDGTVRSLGVLVALFPPPPNGHRSPSLVALEEPEVAIHPGAVRTLGDAFLEAAERVQVLLTTHSPDLLDHDDLRDTMIRAVQMKEGRSYIGPVDAATRSALRDRLYTAGELLRQGQILPAEDEHDISPEQLDMFGDTPGP